jgi:hypothetical protein
MASPSSRKLLSLAALAIIIPISLLTTFKLTGIIPEPPTITETTETETVTLEFDRPFKGVKAPGLKNGYCDESVLVNVSTPPFIDYYDQLASPPSNGRNILLTSVWINASAFHGFVYSVEFSCNVDNVSWVTDGSEYYINVYNATVAEHDATVNRLYYKFRVSTSPTAIRIPLNWIYLDGDGSVDHQLSLSVCTVYYNGTAYREVIVPLIIRVVRDVGDTFEDAKLIESGETFGSLDTVDRADIYAINLEKNQTIFISLTMLEDTDFNLYLHNQNLQELAASAQLGNQMETITYTTNETGIYYVKIEFILWLGHKSDGTYQLKIEILEG